MSNLIEERRAAYIMWRNLAIRRKEGTGSQLRAAVHAYAAGMMLESAYRIASRER